MDAASSPATDLKAACVQAAHDFIAAHGIERLSLRDVARQLGVSHQAPYRHYPSKDHLLAAVIARCFREFAAFLDARPECASAEDDLAALGQQYMLYASSHALEYRLMFGTPWPEAAADSELIRDAVHSFNVLRKVLARLHGKGRGAREKIDQDAMFIWSTMHGYVTIAQCNVMRHLQLAPKVDKNVAPHIFDMVTRAMASRMAQ